MYDVIYEAAIASCNINKDTLQLKFSTQSYVIVLCNIFKPNNKLKPFRWCANLDFVAAGASSQESGIPRRM
jgi:hypothetical protein